MDIVVAGDQAVSTTPSVGFEESELQPQRSSKAPAGQAGGGPCDGVCAWCGMMMYLIQCHIKFGKSVVEAIAIRWRPSQVGWRPSLLVTRSY